MYPGTCNADFESARASVSADTIRLTIKMSGDTDDDCADLVSVRLPELLKGRALIDGSTGEALPVTVATSLFIDEQWVKPVELVD